MESKMQAELHAAVDAAFEAEQVPWLRRLVEQPSHTYAREDVEAAASIVDEAAAALGLVRERAADPSGVFADHRIYSTPAAGEGRALALVGHVDTVFPRSLGFLEFSRDPAQPAIARGPGVLDMKSGLSAVIFALRALKAAAPGLLAGLRARFICVSDEEVGSPSSSAAVFDRLAPLTSAALVFEAGRAGDRIVTSRKGGGLFTITAHGQAAHAGNNHRDGVNAIHALALVIPAIEAMTDYARGVTLSVGLISGGTAKNTVPERASCTIDARFERLIDAETVAARLFGMAGSLARWPGAPERLHTARLEVSGGVTRPPMEASGATQALRAAYEEHAAAAGLGTGEAPLQGGGSDANLLAALGVPCIDGLGPAGRYFHQVEEWCDLESLRRRTQALACFLASEQAAESGR
jgi:glutamate carboxypeptidase